MENLYGEFVMCIIKTNKSRLKLLCTGYLAEKSCKFYVGKL